MRILILSNFYPPARAGGYTQWCQEVSERLGQRGHAIGVLTSHHELTKAPAGEQNIYRLLHLEGDLNYYQPIRFFTRWKAQHRENQVHLERVTHDFDPELIFVWGMWALSKALPARAERLMPGRVVYYLSDYWPIAPDWHTTYWQAAARRRGLRPFKRALSYGAMAILAAERQPDLKLEKVICVSASLRDRLVSAGLPIQKARVIHGGTDVERFTRVRERRNRPGQLKLLYAGQLAEHKGVHTAIEAMARLVKQHRRGRIDLTLVGQGHPQYEAYLHDLVAQERIQDLVTFDKPVPKEDMPAVLQRFDVLILPSTYEEPLARISQEAMASGLVVVGTPTGGTQEILKHGETGLTFAPRDALGLAQQVTRLITDPGLRSRLAQVGRQTVLANFTLDTMVTAIEGYLADCLAGSSKS